MNISIASNQLSREYYLISALANLANTSESPKDAQDFYNMYDGCAFE